MNDHSPPAVPLARILVVDDEPGTCKAIARALNMMDYRADEAISGSQALATLASSPYDLMLLDLNMPGMDGVEVMQRVQHAYPGLQVIIFTAYATLDSAIAAVKAGAADYLLKPCKIRDIEAAIARALQRRRERLRRQHLIRVIAEALEALQAEEEQEMTTPPGQPERFLQRGPVALDRERRLAVVGEADGAASFNVKLTANEAALLAYLMQHSETVFSCRELAWTALGYDVSEREARYIVRPHISRLRKKIELDPVHPRLLRTIRGKGYIFSPV
jgi:DNA-binding response OmpR family regulator